jgi:cephalosporin hydroxylase
LGIPTLKCPLDLWIYQEIIYEIKPDLIIETGTAYGGSALYLAHLCDLMGKGNVVTVDIENQAKRPKHSRIEYLTGSSVDPVILSKMGERVQKAKTVLVILDSDHRKPHVFQELQCYGPWVTKDSYLIVEDTNVNGHPVDPEYGPGPMEAVEDFLKGNNQFAADRQREKFYLTFNPSGYLKRIA